MSTVSGPTMPAANKGLTGQGIVVPGNTALRLPRTILFGRGLVDQLGDVVSGEGRVSLICSDPGVSTTAAFRHAMRSLASAGITRHAYLRTPVDVPVESVHECVGIARGRGIDVIVAIGGGSAIDLAKLAALLLSHPGDLSSYYGEDNVPGPCLPVIAVPTTAGTGSEVSPVAVLRDPSRQMKVGISSRYLVPNAAVCDPELTLSCPPEVSAYSGIDALAHAVEAYTAAARPASWTEYPGPVFHGKNFFSDSYALTAVELIHAGLEQAVSNGNDLDARTMMLFGSLSAGIAFAHAGTAGAHALQYPIGAMTSTPHGLGVGLLMPYVLDFIRPAAERDLAAIGRAMGIRAQNGDAETALAAVDEVWRLTRAVGVPAALSELGISESDLPKIASDASTVSRLLANSPRLLDRDALMTILFAAWNGDRNERRDPAHDAGVN